MDTTYRKLKKKKKYPKNEFGMIDNYLNKRYNIPEDLIEQIEIKYEPSLYDQIRLKYLVQHYQPKY